MWPPRKTKFRSEFFHKPICGADSPPAGEREAFARLFHELQSPVVPKAGNSNAASGSGSGNWPDFGGRLKRIYGNKVVAYSQAVISYARGE